MWYFVTTPSGNLHPSFYTFFIDCFPSVRHYTSHYLGNKVQFFRLFRRPEVLFPQTKSRLDSLVIPQVLGGKSASLLTFLDPTRLSNLTTLSVSLELKYILFYLFSHSASLLTRLWASRGQELPYSSLCDSRLFQPSRNHSTNAPRGVIFALSHHRSLSVFLWLLLEVFMGTVWKNQVFQIEEVGASLSFINISFLDPFPCPYT